MFFFVKQKTAYEMRISDWSSDVCSSDLPTRTLLSLCGLPDDVAAELLLQELLLEEPPLWLYAAVVDDEVRWENVPQADQEALEQLLEEIGRASCRESVCQYV